MRLIELLLAPRRPLMESVEVLPPSGANDTELDIKQDLDWAFVDPDHLMNPDDLTPFQPTNGSMSADLASVLLSDAGTTLAEMLHTESVLQSTDATTATSCTLTQLLTNSDHMTHVTNNNVVKTTSLVVSPVQNAPAKMMDAIKCHAPTTSEQPPTPRSSPPTVSEHTLSTAGTLVQILQNGTQNAVLQPAQEAAMTPSCTTAAAMEALMTEFEDSAIDVTGDCDIDIRPEGSLFYSLEAQSLAMLNGEDSNMSFGNGIEATDMCSLLEQFEAAGSYPGGMEDSIDILSGIENNSDSLTFDPNSVVDESMSLLDDEPNTSNAAVPADEPLKVFHEGQGHIEAEAPPVVSPDSEVVKLLKAPTRVQTITKAVTPSPEVIQKIKSSTKRKATIMLDELLPTSKVCAKGSQKMPAYAARKLLKIQGTDSASQDSALNKKETKKKLSLKQYQQRLRQKVDPSNEDSVDSLSSEGSGVVTCARNSDLDSQYFKVIVDHDYCSNVKATEHEVVVQTDKSSKKAISTKDAVAAAKEAEHNSMLKSLLLNKNLSEELKVQAEKDRAVTRRNMRTPDPNTQTKHEVAESASGAQRSSKEQSYSRWKRNYRKHEPSPPPEEIEPQSRAVIDKLPSYCTTLSVQPIPGMTVKKASTTSKLIDTTLPLRDRDPSPERSGPVFNKIPGYFSDFTNSTRYDGSKASGDPLAIDADNEQYPWDRLRSSLPNSRSHSPTSFMEIRSRPTSRLHSRASSRQRSYHSRSSSSSSSTSRSRSRSRPWRPSKRNSRRGSVSSRSHSRSRSHSLTKYRSRSPSTSSSSSCSTCRSYSPSSRSPSRYRSTSRDRDRECHRRRRQSRSQRKSRSRSSYRSRSRCRSRSTSQRSRSRSRSWDRYRELIKKRREAEKQQQIRDRRIVYVGRIPNGTMRRDLRRKFGHFGEIEDVSVHFREHGDNYGFVTFLYTCDAFAAIEKGKSLQGCEDYDLCFGGRREFCKDTYADLDGNKEEEEELGPVMAQNASLNFDDLLRQATKKIKKTKDH